MKLKLFEAQDIQGIRNKFVRQFTAYTSGSESFCPKYPPASKTASLSSAQQISLPLLVIFSAKHDGVKHRVAAFMSNRSHKTSRFFDGKLQFSIGQRC